MQYLEELKNSLGCLANIGWINSWKYFPDAGFAFVKCSVAMAVKLEYEIIDLSCKAAECPSALTLIIIESGLDLIAGMDGKSR